MLLLIFVLVGFIASCNKDNEVDVPQEAQALDKTQGYSVIDGILNFNSGDDVYNLNIILSSMNDSELNDWEKGIGFTSLRSEINDVYSQIDDVSSYKDYEAKIAQNSDIVSLVDSCMSEKITNRFYSMIINRNGYFIVGGTLHKVTSEGVVTDENQCYNNVELKAENPYDVEIEGIGFVPNVSSMKSFNAYCGSNDDEESNWHNNRQCFAHVSVDRVYCLDACCTHQYWYSISCRTEARGKNIFGGTKLYKSVHHLNYLQVKIDAPTGEYYANGNVIYSTVTYNYDGSTASSELKTQYWLSAHAVGEKVEKWDANSTPVLIPLPDMRAVKGEFYTQGSYPEKAIINCGYGY